VTPPTACPWCGTPRDDRWRALPGRVRCPHCGVALTDPWPTPAELAAAYGTWYRPESGRRFSFVGDALLRRTRGLLARRLDDIAPPGPILDVGAGDGTLIDALRRRGREAVGLERDARHPHVRDATLAETDGEWAAVVFWHALEHLPDPGDAIDQAARLLGSDGVVVVAVPDNASLQAAAFGAGWLHLDMPRHLVHLTGAALTAGLERRGLTVERTSRTRGGQIVIGWLDGLVGALPGRLDLYQALRRPTARSAAQPLPRRLAACAAAVALLPVAAAGAWLEVVAGRSGTVYVEARRLDVTASGSAAPR
jgi:SAM-dependent methyltransferase